MNIYERFNETTLANEKAFYSELYLKNFDDDCIKNYNEDNDKGYILKVDIEYPKNLRSLHSDLPFLAERIKI